MSHLMKSREVLGNLPLATLPLPPNQVMKPSQQWKWGSGDQGGQIFGLATFCFSVLPLPSKEQQQFQNMWRRKQGAPKPNLHALPRLWSVEGVHLGGGERKIGTHMRTHKPFRQLSRSLLWDRICREWCLGLALSEGKGSKWDCAEGKVEAGPAKPQPTLWGALEWILPDGYLRSA